MEHFPETIPQNLPAKYPPGQAGFKRGTPMSSCKGGYTRNTSHIPQIWKDIRNYAYMNELGASTVGYVNG